MSGAGDERPGAGAGGDPGAGREAELGAQLAALAERVAQLERVLAVSGSGSGAALERRSAMESQAPRVEASAASTYFVPPPPLPSALPMQPVEAAIAPAAPRASLEDRLGAQVFNWIGMAALLIGVSWALKLAFEHGLIGPVGRVIIGLAAGAGLIVWSERFRRKALPAFSYSLKAVGSGVLYLSLWAAFQIYHLLPAAAAFAAMLLVTAWIAFMAWSQDAELLAAYALAGGLATPLLLSTGGDHEAFLFGYLLAIDAATTLLLRFKPWTRLLPATFVATIAYFIGWYATYFHRGGIVVWDQQSTETALFVGLFFAVFALVSLRGWREQTAAESRARSGVTDAVLLPLANAAFLALALYSVFQDSGLHSNLAWLMLVLAALALALSRVQATALAAAMQVAIAVVLLTIAIPLKASGHSLTTAWLVEGLVLYWAAKRAGEQASDSGRVLRFLSAGGYVLGLLALAFNVGWRGETVAGSFFNADLGASLVAAAALAATAWLALRREPGGGLRVADPAGVVLSLLGINFVGLILISREVATLISYAGHAAFASAEFGMAVIGLVLLAGVSLAAYRLYALEPAAHQELTILAGGTLIAFNLAALFTGVREISALWPRYGGPDLSVQRSLAVSAFLMVYGAALLAAGFWRRSAFVRWQALVLLIFTILKVFLYDVSGLSQGYRVVSFLGLGALLMGVSLAYQRDWLGLKAAAAGSSASPDLSGPDA